MHPLLRDRRALVVYLAAWTLLGALLAVAVAARDPGSGATAALLALPMSLLYGFLCLAAWYPCRANPLPQSPLTRAAAVHLAAALLSTALWLLIGRGWALALGRAAGFADAEPIFLERLALFFTAGVLLYLLAAAVHYLLLAFQASRRSERQTMELSLQAKQAELEAFKAQIDPHFLFNSLNSISSLCGSDPLAARQTAIRLGELLRASLKLGTTDSIPLAQELGLASAYLDVERVRYGERLIYEQRMGPGCLDRRVPPLLLQPLLENALKHGIAHLLEGGSVALEGELANGRLRLLIVNPCDPERPREDGRGIGLANVRGRLRLLYGEEARLTARDRGSSFEVEILLPEER